MATYCFDVDDGDGTRDEFGLRCNSREAIKEAAIQALPGLAAENLPDGNPYHCKVAVRDETGQTVFDAVLTVESRWLGE